MYLIKFVAIVSCGSYSRAFFVFSLEEKCILAEYLLVSLFIYIYVQIEPRGTIAKKRMLQFCCKV